MKKTYKVDLDYESYLFDPFYKEDNSQSIKIIKEFEYVFFLINQTDDVTLKNYQNYSQEYLNYLKNLKFEIPQLDSKTDQFEYWWGKRTNKELEMKLNSKLTSANIAQKNGWGFFEGQLVNNLDEISQHIKSLPNKKFILKNPFGFSGIGHIVFDREFLPLIQFQNTMLLEPIYNRICDLGITFEIENKEIKRIFIVENFNNDKGSFKGGMGTKTIDTFIKLIKLKYHFDLTNYLDTYKNICNYYLSLGADSNIQIDSFIYEINGELKLYPLVEVNYRKTMGLVIQSLADRSISSAIEWRVTHTNQFENQAEWIKLSPSNNKFNSYLKNVDVNRV